MAVGFSSGCHRCGGYPGHKSLDRAYLVECTECGTYTCNQHITLTGGCPQCKSGKTKKVMTQRDVKKHKKGSKVDSSGSAGKGSKQDSGKGSAGGNDFDEGGNLEGGFARGGTELPKKNQDTGATVKRDPDTALPEELLRTENRIKSILDEGNSISKGSSDSGEIPSFNRLERNAPEQNIPGNSTLVEERNLTEKNVHHEYKEKEVIKEGEGADKPLSVRRYDSLDDLFEEMPAKNSSSPISANEPDEKTDEDENEELEEGIEKDSEREESPQEADEEHDDVNSEQEDENDDTARKAEPLSDDEKAEIDQEFKEIAKLKRNRLDDLTDIDYMVTLAQTKRELIKPTHHLADAFWGLTQKGPAAKDEIKSYIDSINKLKASAQKDRSNPDIYINLLFFEPLKGENTTNIKTLEYLDDQKGIYYGLGFGPRAVNGLNPEDTRHVVQALFSKGKKALAIGVIGLDMHYAPYTIDTQKAFFKEQLNVAMEAKLPVFITARKAEDQLLECLEEANVPKGYPIVLTDIIQTKKAIELVQHYDMHICLRPELTHDSHKEALEFTKKVNPARWLLCGGYGHSAPKGYETGWNSPAYLPATSSMIADMMGRGDESLRTVCVGNLARLLFGKPWRTEKGEKEDLWAEFR